MNALPPLALLLAAAVATATATPVAERWSGPAIHPIDLAYRVDFGPFIGAGRLEFRLAPVPTGANGRLLVEARGATRGLARAFYRFDASTQSIIDAPSARVLESAWTGSDRDESSAGHILYDHGAGVIVESQPNGDQPSRKPLPPGPRLDLIAAFFEARWLPLEPGTTSELPVLYEGQLLTLKVTAGERRDLPTPFGRRRAVALSPATEGEATRFFQRGGRLTLWVTEDAERLPVRLEVRTRHGTGVAKLIEASLESRTSP